MSASKISHEDFVVAWTTASCIEDVMRDTGLSKAGARYRAKMLIGLGVQLKKMPKPVLDRLRIAQLNSLVNKHQPGQRS